MEKLIELLSNYFPLSIELKSRLRDTIDYIEVDKRKRVLSHNEVCNNVYFVEKGFARGVRIVKEKEVTTWFWRENDLMTSIHSFLNQEPSLEAIEILEDSCLLRLSYEDLQHLYQDFIEFNVIGRKLIEHYFLTAGEITDSLRSKSAKERYQQLMSSHPDIFQRTTLRNISSYLGMTNETISRLRKKA